MEKPDARIATEKKNPLKSGSYLTKDGYRMIYKPGYRSSNQNNYCLEHRYVVELYIGRFLKKKEAVHHLNSKRTDNRISNLMLFSSQKAHKTFENRLRREGWTHYLRLQVRDRWVPYKRKVFK